MKRKKVAPRPSLLRLPSLPLDVLRRVEEIERYAADSLKDCERGLAFNTERAFRLLRSCAVSVFDLQIEHYRSLPDFDSRWLKSISRGVVRAIIGQLGMHVLDMQSEAIEGELIRTLTEHVQAGESKTATRSQSDAQEVVESAAQQIARFRQESHITVEELAEELGVDPRSVARHLSGESAPHGRHLAAYERVFSERLKTKVVIR